MAWFYNLIFPRFFKIGLVRRFAAPARSGGLKGIQICVFPKEFENSKIRAFDKFVKNQFFNGLLVSQNSPHFWHEKRQLGLF